MLTKHCAEQGFTEAMILLAEQYQKGIGTNIDLQQAKLWLLKAGHNGNKEAMEMLINLYLFQ
jgi:TPR repeat protein